LGVFDRFIEWLTLFHQLEQDVGARIEDTLEAFEFHGGQRSAEMCEDWCAVHYRGFKEEAAAFLRGQVRQFAVGVHHRPFVGGDGVHAAFESRTQVIDGRLAGEMVNWGVFEYHLRRVDTNKFDHRSQGSHFR